MKMRDIALYLAIGGLFAGLCDRYLVDECDKRLGGEYIALLITLWPGYIIGAIVSKPTSDTNICEEGVQA